MHGGQERWAELALGTIGESGRRAGAARRAVVDMLAGQDCCLSAQEIAENLRSAGEGVGTASVYRALDLLHREGLVTRLEVGQGGARYERAHPGGDHHHHVVCERCGTITPFEDRELERAIEQLSRRLRHRVSGHDVLIRGRCRDCGTEAA